MNKRKREDDFDRKAKRERRRKRSKSEPSCDSSTNAKRVALKKLFGRVCSVELDDSHRVSDDETSDSSEAFEESYQDENEDPLLDSVPVNMDPEQLGFLVCAQETLRFLHRRGLSVEHPVFAKLRTLFLRGLTEMGMA